MRNEREFEKIQSYIEENPVRAGLVREANEYRWSSAAWVRASAPPRPGGCKYRYAQISLAWPTLTLIAHFCVAHPTGFSICERGASAN